MADSPHSMTHDREQLLAEIGWVRALAGRLVRDDGRADDLAQGTVAAALEHPPRHREGPGLRAWLATVMKNVLRQSARTDARRESREHVAARREAVPSAADVVARGSLHRRLIDAVMQLDEPYRTTILLRYLEERSVAEIAERQGVEPPAVRKRLSRGLGFLRARLDREHGGDRSAWVGLAIPFAGDAAATVAKGVIVMSTKKVATVVAVPLLVGGVWWGVGDPGQSGPPAAVAHVRETVEPPPLAEASRPPVAVDPGGETVRSEAPELLPDPTPVTLTGRVVAIDQDGNRYDDESGHFRLSRATADERVIEGSEQRVRFSAGVFSVVVEPSARIAIRAIHLDRSSSSVTTEKSRPFPADAFLEIRVHRVRPVSLSVVDDAFGQALKDVDVVDTRDLERETASHPGGFELAAYAARRASSPVQLRRHGHVVRYLVSAEGFAWTNIEIDHSTGGDRAVRLVREAELDLRTGFVPQGVDVVFRLLRDAERLGVPDLELSIGPDETRRLNRLPAGTYDAALQIGANPADAITLATAKVELVAGERASVTLEAEGAPEALTRAEVPLAGTLTIPLAWGDRDARLEVAPLDRPRLESDDVSIATTEMTADPRDPRRLHWEAGDVLPGRYELKVKALELLGVVELGPAGDRAVHLEAALPHEVTVRLLAAAPDQPLKGGTVFWEMLTADGKLGYRSEKHRDEAGARFLAPPGRMRLFAIADGHRIDSRVVDVIPGTNDFTLTAAPVQTIAVSFRDGDTAVPVDVAAVGVAPVTGAGRIVQKMTTGDRLELAVSEPGQYRVSIGALEGFDAVEPRVVDVPAGERVAVVIDLGREP